MLERIWSFEIQIAPIILAFIIFQVPSMIHKLKKQYYVPIYFSVFPFNIINKSLSTYLVDDYLGENMTDKQAEEYRRKVIFISAISVTISVIVIPALTGFLSTFFLSDSTLFQFLLFLSIYLIFVTLKSILNFKHHSISSKGNTAFLSIIYFLYVGMVIYVIYISYMWAQNYTKVGDWLGLLNSSVDFIFGTIGIKGIMPIIIMGAFSHKIFDRKIRQEKIEEIKYWSND
ncbi:MAG: hypothetical protein JJE17_00580 [Peptostreptococcaceae bacterium]|nr:hypothetical protein [Peptostreptococcaceae bacterium]